MSFLPNCVHQKVLQVFHQALNEELFEAIKGEIMKSGQDVSTAVSAAAQKVIDEVKTTAAAEREQYVAVIKAVKEQSGISDADLASAVASVEGISPAVKSAVEGIADVADAGAPPVGDPSVP